ncbi:unnamed protein product [Rotaria sp. Silwood2]|nr:unnamed protein product [Rotaria sp. Silwood2]
MSAREIHSIEFTDAKRDALVYISDLPSHIDDDVQLARLVRNRLENFLLITPISIVCYSKLGAGLMRVRDNQIKARLIQDIKKIVLNPPIDASMVSFNATIQLVSFVVIENTNENRKISFPKPEEILIRWIKIYKESKPYSCDLVNIQFPNIYRVISLSFDDLSGTLSKTDFSINDLVAHVYVGADCSYFENLPKSMTREHLQEAICKSIGVENRSLVYIEVNKQTKNACILASDQARKWSAKSFLYLNGKPISRKEYLICRLLVHPISKIYNNDEILNHTMFRGKAKLIEQQGENLVLEILDKEIFENCLTLSILSIENKPELKMEIYVPFTNREDCEINIKTWYRYEMTRYKPDIMQFIADLNHSIFRYKWNADAWLQEYQNRTEHLHLEHKSSLLSDQSRRLLQMTVMLNTIGTILKKSYLINNKQVALNLDPKLKTIVYNHESLLEYGSAAKLTVTPYKETNVEVVNEDCVILYENCCKRYKKPLLLNMADAIIPGGGYITGDGTQEGNLFQRSDYFRSLDVGLDHIQEKQPERFYCSHDGQILSLSDHTKMYPIDEYGAIYTSGLTFFRKSSNNGYQYMDKPLKNVYVLGMPAYSSPKLDGNFLSPKYAVGLRKKIENIFSIAYYHKHDCLILSALGCGAFRNPPNHVSKLFRSVIEQYAGFFQTIIFSIIDDHNTGQKHNLRGNFKIFHDELHGLIVRPMLPFAQPNTICGPYRTSSDGSMIFDVRIFDLHPCQFGAICNEFYDSKHVQNYSHPPLCKQWCLTGTCTQMNEIVHMFSFIHRYPCRYGAQCKDINNEKHIQEYEHPFYCSNGGYCQDTSSDHEKAYRHLPMCEDSQRCLKYQEHITNHIEKFRHCIPNCEYENSCVHLHEREHYENYKHPFPFPCLITPYRCPLYQQFTMAKEKQHLSSEIRQHCLNFTHVCPLGRNCTNNDPSHLETSIHVLEDGELSNKERFRFLFDP